MCKSSIVGNKETKEGIEYLYTYVSLTYIQKDQPLRPFRYVYLYPITHQRATRGEGGESLHQDFLCSASSVPYFVEQPVGEETKWVYGLVFLVLVNLILRLFVD